MKGIVLVVLLFGAVLAQSYPPNAHTTRLYSRAPFPTEGPSTRLYPREQEPKTTRAPKFPTSPAPLKIDTTQGSTKLYSRRPSTEGTTKRSIPRRTSPFYEAVTNRNKRAAAGSPTQNSKNDDAFVAELNQFWETNYILREKTLIDVLVYADRHRDQNVTQDVSSLFQAEGLPYRFDTVLDRYKDSIEVQNYVKEFREAPYTTRLKLPKLLETFNSYSNKEQEAYLDKLGRTGPVYHFFDEFRSLENGYSDFLMIHGWNMMLTQNAWRKLLKSWRSLGGKYKEMVKDVMSKDVDNETCSDIWQRMQEDPDMEDFALVIDVMDYRWFGKSCFLRYSIKQVGPDYFGSTIAPYMIEKQVLWNKASRLGAPELVELLKYASEHDNLFADILLLTQNYTSGDFFKKVDSLFFKYPGFKRILDLLIKCQNSNFQQILSMTKAFYSMTSTEKEDLHSKVTYHSDYSQYLTDIWFVKSVVPNLEILELLNDGMKTDFLSGVIRVWGELDKKEKSMTARVVFNRATDAECKMVFDEKPSVVGMAKVLDSSGFESCFQKNGFY